MERGTGSSAHRWWRRRGGGDDETEPTAGGGSVDEARMRDEVAAAEERGRATAQRESEERVRQWLSHQWAEIRSAREPATPTIGAGPSNFARAQVPYGMDLAAAWAWRFIVIAVAGLMLLWTARFFVVVLLPLVLALFIAALVAPVVNRLDRAGLPRKLAALLVVVIGVGVVGLLLTFVGQQVIAGIGDLSGQVADGLEQIRTWLRTGPFEVTDSQINDFLKNAQQLVTEQGQRLTSQVTEISTTVGHVVAGFFIVLFATYFFLADGALIWSWLVRIFPRAARVRADESGRVAFRSLTQFVRATVLVAGTDAIGIVIWAAVLGLPFLSAIGVLVFLGAFVPMIGATLSGAVAVLVALVAKGPVAAVLMLAGVIVVQQVEAHVLQPFLMGRFVSVHPLGVIVAIAAGVILAGIAGALVAVPLAAALNAVVQHLASHTRVGEGAEDAAARDPGPGGEPSAEQVADAGDAPDPRGTDGGAVGIDGGTGTSADGGGRAEERTGGSGADNGDGAGRGGSEPR